MKKERIGKIIFSIMITLLMVFALVNIFCFFTRGKQIIDVKTSTNYYSQTAINASIEVKDRKTDRPKDSTIKAVLYDHDDKKVKDVEGKWETKDGVGQDISLDLPEDLKTGAYVLKITAKSGLLKDTMEVPINIVNDVKSNTIISLDKGIYKPGDTVNFRALMLAKKDDKPITTDVSVAIYDGNDNKVYSNSTKTSEYGIVSGTFKLANEVNSGTYKIVVSTESQETSKTFTVNPYITPKFEVGVTTDKESYIVGDTAEIKISAKYFFGEPVKGADIEGSINGKRVVGLTNDSGEFVIREKLEEAEAVDLNFKVTDTSNYMIEENKTVYVGTDIFEIEVFSKYSGIYKGIDNEVYVVTKTMDGNPVKTYSTITLGVVNKQIISDENGFGKTMFTADELSTISNYDVATVKVKAEDMNGNVVEKVVEQGVVQNFDVLVDTDKEVYNYGEDITIDLLAKIDTAVDKDIFILKNNELIKTIVTDGESVDVNLEGITGLVDIWVPSKRTTSSYSNSINRFSYGNNPNYTKKTIFIRPNNALNIDIKTDSEEYRPGDTLNISFTTKNETNENVDAALLISILDEAILSLAENDLNIDNIKLALQDVVLGEGITAADLYAMVLDDSSSAALQTILLKQNSANPNIINKRFVDKDVEVYLLKCIGAAILVVAMVLGWAVKTSEKARKFIAKTIVPTINVIAIFVVIMISFGDILYEIEYVSNAFMTVISVAIISICIYVLFLYKEQDFIFKTLRDLILVPLVLATIFFLIVMVLSAITGMYEDTIAMFVLWIIILAVLLEYTILTSIKRKDKLSGKLKSLYDFLRIVISAIVFWIVLLFLANITEVGIAITFVGYYIYRKVILKESNTKLKDGKIVFNINSSEVVGMFVGIIMVVLVLIFFASIINNFAGSSITDDRYVESEPMEFGNSGLLYDMAQDADTFKGAGDTSGAASSTNNFFNSITSSVVDTLGSDTTIQNSAVIEKDDVVTETEIEKDLEVEENVRNVFLESLAFVPELVTKNGVANYETEISDNITTWNIQTVGNTKDGDVGYASATFKVFKEFFVDFTLPTNSVVTDKVSIPVTLYNYTENALPIDVLVKENEWAKIGEYDKNITVDANSTKMIYVPIEIIKDGNNVLRIETKSNNLSDIVEKSMEVKLNGLEMKKVASSGVIEKDYYQDIIFNENAIENSKKVRVKLYASPITQVIENIDAMLQLPTGCFEQTSSSLYPDALILKYLRENELNKPEIEAKALDYISRGYQRLLTFEVDSTKGGYSLYGDAPAEPVLTAFGLMEMKEIAGVYEVDENVIDEMKEYLFSVQKADGSFNIRSTYIGGASNTDDLAMNAYIVWALSEACPDDTRLAKSINYLYEKFEKTTDNYTLALMANAFANSGEKNKANEVIKVMSSSIQTTNDGAYVSSKIRDYYGTTGRYQNTQTTALLSIALTKMQSNANTNKQLINYLVTQIDTKGTWGTTQSTVLALKAINEYGSNSDLKDQTIKVSLNGKEQSVEIKKDALDVYEFVFEDVDVENKLDIKMKKGKITYEVIKEYYEEYENVTIENDIEVSQTIDTQTTVNGIVNQQIKVQNKSEYIENGLVEISIPQGMTPIEDTLLNLKYDGKIEKYDYNYGKINLYLRGLKANSGETFDIQYRALYPEEITGAAIRVYDYYNPDVEGISLPVKMNVTE